MPRCMPTRYMTMPLTAAAAIVAATQTASKVLRFIVHLHRGTSGSGVPRRERPRRRVAAARCERRSRRAALAAPPRAGRCRRDRRRAPPACARRRAESAAARERAHARVRFASRAARRRSARGARAARRRCSACICSTAASRAASLRSCRCARSAASGSDSVRLTMFEYDEPRWLNISSALQSFSPSARASAASARALSISRSRPTRCGSASSRASTCAASWTSRVTSGRAPSGARAALEPTQRSSATCACAMRAVGRCDAVVEPRHFGARGEHLGLGTTAAAVCGLGGIDLQPRFVALAHEQLAQAFEVEAFEPGQRGVAAQRDEPLVVLRARGGGFGLEARAARAQFVGARELLHRADRAHRHGVARGAEAVGALDRQVGERQAQHRVGPLAGGDGASRARRAPLLRWRAAAARVRRRAPARRQAGAAALARWCCRRRTARARPRHGAGGIGTAWLPREFDRRRRRAHGSAGARQANVAGKLNRGGDRAGRSAVAVSPRGARRPDAPRRWQAAAGAACR